jgi:hypothetical protein
MMPITREATEAARQAYSVTSALHCGFLYGNRHVVRNLGKPLGQQEVWSITEDGADELGQGPNYDRCHDAMMAEIERIAFEAALTAALPFLARGNCPVT